MSRIRRWFLTESKLCRSRQVLPEPFETLQDAHSRALKPREFQAQLSELLMSSENSRHGLTRGACVRSTEALQLVRAGGPHQFQALADCSVERCKFLCIRCELIRDLAGFRLGGLPFSLVSRVAPDEEKQRQCRENERTRNQ